MIATPLLFKIFNTIDYDSDEEWFTQPKDCDIRTGMQRDRADSYRTLYKFDNRLFYSIDLIHPGVQ
jgi:hypothetical protein